MHPPRPEVVAGALVARIREAVAEDPRTHAMDFSIRVVGPVVTIAGEVPSEARRRAIEDVTREHVPIGMHLKSELTIADYPEPDEVEVIE